MGKHGQKLGKNSPKYVSEGNAFVRFNEGLGEEQLAAKKLIGDKVLTTIRGQAGSGKTFVAVNYALEEFMKTHYGGIDGIIITRAMINKKEHDMGFLTGDMYEKFDPWIIPIKEIVAKHLGNEVIEKMMRERTLDIAPMAFVKGRTFTNKVVIVDEAQDLTRRDCEALFTRIGVGSKMIFMGDIRQCDLPHSSMSGFPLLCDMAAVSEYCGDIQLSSNYRSPIVEDLLKKYKDNFGN